MLKNHKKQWHCAECILQSIFSFTCQDTLTLKSLFSNQDREKKHNLCIVPSHLYYGYHDYVFYMLSAGVLIIGCVS